MGNMAPRSMLGAFIRRQRELSDMSMRQMSTLVGISNPYLSQIERGLRAPSETVTAAIAATLGITVDELYEQSGVDRGTTGASELGTAIQRATELSGTQREVLLGLYRSFMAVNRAMGVSLPGRRAKAESADPADPS
ncbi:MAG: helix-turn-helix domain-containing protein [Propionibacteriaceae bacterium]|nr:helix-turn-helix domain-containing protein [Propionibacteriaceae bacterium]